MIKLSASAMVLIASTALSSPSYALYSTRAANFAGSYLITTIHDPHYVPIDGSSQGVCSLWYNSTYAPSTFSIFIQAISNNQSIFGLSIIKSKGLTKKYNLNLFLSDGAVPPLIPHWVIFHSANSLNFDGNWHHISITWDTETYDEKTKLFAAVASYGTLRQQGPPTVLLWDAISRTDGSGDGFATPYQNSLITIGAGLDLGNGRVHGFYRGSMSQVFCNFGVSRYTDIISSFGSPSTVRVHSGVSESDQFGLYSPTELGNKCRGPFGAPVPGTEDLDAAICMTGGPSSFYDNQGGDTKFFNGPQEVLPLQSSPTDPFGGTAQ